MAFLKLYGKVQMKLHILRYNRLMEKVPNF